MRYFRRRWAEERDDIHSGWGHSWWHFATDDDGVVSNQVEVYDNGTVRVYDGVAVERLVSPVITTFQAAVKVIGDRSWIIQA